MARAKAICTCKKCGTEFEKMRVCNHWNRRDADSWEEWAVTHYDLCPDCWEKEQAERERREIAAMNLPELQGAEKQIAWANKIRLQNLRAIDELAEMIKPHQHERFSELADVIKGKESAGFWIDNRHCNVYSLLGLATGKEIDTHDELERAEKLYEAFQEYMGNR